MVPGPGGSPELLLLRLRGRPPARGDRDEERPSGHNCC